MHLDRRVHALKFYQNEKNEVYFANLFIIVIRYVPEPFDSVQFSSSEAILV